MSEENRKKYKYLYADSPEVINGKSCNIIPEPESEPLWKAYLAKFKDPIIIILLVALGLSLCISFYEMLVMGRSASCLIEPLGVLIAILLATGIAFIFEYNAEKEFKILNKAKDERKVKVLRWRSAHEAEEGAWPQVYEIPRGDVCIGDIVKLESGDEIPADGILLEAISLRVDESNFTGEPFTRKFVEIDPTRPESTYPQNFLLRGTTLIEGTALYKITAIGPETEEGKGARILQEESTVETPLNNQLNHLAKRITKASYFIAALLIIGRLLIFFLKAGSGERELLDIIHVIINSVMLAVTLIVVTVPEGLPMSVTISLALSMRKMLKEKNLVRKLHACETMGATTVICIDKTGTLTYNKMSVVEQEFSGTDMDFVALSISVNSTAELSEIEPGKLRAIGNPTEGALLLWLHDLGYDYRALRKSLDITFQEPFSTESKRMITVTKDERTGKSVRYIKGAPEILLEMSDRIAGNLTKEEILSYLQSYQTKGMRTLGFAYQELDAKDEAPVIFTGIVGIADPVRNDVREAMDICRNHAGVRVIMVTGDVALTANEIARQTGIMDIHEPMQNLSGAEFARMSDEEIKTHIIPGLKVLSRARPEDKARLVTLLQEMGEVVAVTGDGTNDAPALKKAQVGLSMGDGTSIAKEASDITIIDNSFSSINKGILFGRSLYLNIKRFIIFQMTINLGACLIVLMGAFMELDSPLTVTQMLWVNLIMDTFAAMALSSIPPDRRVMNDPPRDSNSYIIDRKMAIRIIVVGFISFIVMIMIWRLLWHTDITSVKDLLNLDTLNIFLWDALAPSIKPHLSGFERGVFFSIFVMLQFWNLFNVRYFRTNRSVLKDILDSIFNRKRFRESASPTLLLVAAIILLGQYFITNIAGAFFDVAPLSLSDWWLILLCTSPVLFIPDIWRFVRNLFSAQREKQHAKA
ncbi:MAG TPA: calcium-translocating P-type ATPase, PMCA-type [Bacteroidales bacterium]|nr:calcium-translocating P-type ATPase, PMCA-type [Bacteroidales bacterium]HPY21317.1 calcium-translocating P-type ATPase, PMCA-type [Bacteroidales bacterium]HQA92706.1 calcium-translocating P-type ATPase, PMCA-type [Bacteroidales bacterium]HQN24400.1 calcium-translocating P-type ATPase, PMCA-type [Bacteroidales bacterium]HQP79456.1 calcium-translocating P-type ATPase, PMCA-type [Bacteroidales bacterium]